MRLAWLHECPGVGPAVLSRVIHRYQGAPPAEFFGRYASWYRAEFGVTPRTAESLQTHLAAVPARLAKGHHLPIDVVIEADIGYFPELKPLSASIPMIYLHGSIPNRLSISNLSVISSQNEELRNDGAVKSALRTATDAGWRLVTGHNRPVYQWALLAAKRTGRAALLVLDRGLIAAFDEDLRRDPVSAARIWGYAFDSDRMLALSPFRLYDPWIGANARLRDAIIVALSEVVIAIGVREGGTMHRLCAEAAARGQTVFAAPDCLPFLEPHGATAWTGALPPAASARSSAGEIG